MVHNDYGVYSGEEAVVDRMIADGRGMGHEIETLRLSSKDSRDRLSGKIRAFFAGMWSIRGRHLMRKALRTFQPDIVHIHNLYPFISPAVLPLCHRHGVPVVMTVHNYRLICPTGLFLRNGKPCENCLRNGNERDCIRYNCEESLFRSVAYALRNMVARRTRAYLDGVDYYCCLTDFQKEKLIAAGFDESKIKVFPNVVDAISGDEPCQDEEPFVGYVGRHNYSKGDDLVAAIATRHPEIPFRFAGIAPDEVVQETSNIVQSKRDKSPLLLPSQSNVTEGNVTYCGMLDRKALMHFYRQARFIVIPSRCYEGFPMVLLESFAHGKCCIAPAHGPFPSLLKDPDNGQECGLLFTPMDLDDMELQIVTLWNQPDKAARMGAAAHNMAERRFSRQAVNQQWNEFLLQVADKNSL